MFVKRVLCITALLCLLFLSCGCQPTPEKQVVINKGEDNLNKIIDANNSGMPTEVSPIPASEPIEWKDSFSSIDEKTQIIVDATVTVPPVNTIPVLEVEPSHFTSEQIKQAANALFDGSEIYSGKDVLTKSMIEENIIDINKSISEYESENDSGKYDYMIGKLKASIERFEELYKTVSDELPKEPPCYEFKDCMINLYTDTSGKDARFIDVFDSGDRDSELLFTTNREYVVTEEVLQSETNIGDQLSYTEAKETANRYLVAMGIDYMDISYAQVGRRAISDDNFQGDKTGEKNVSGTINEADKNVEPDELCYVFYYTRNINGVSATYIKEHNGTSVDGVDGGKIYRAPWKQEYIEVFVDQNGIASLKWESPTSVTGYKSENASILSFEESKDIAKKNLQIIYNQFIMNQNVTMYITRIIFGMTRIAVNGEDKKYIFVPSWDFFGYYEITTNSDTKYVSSKNAYTMLTINAIDGSIIDRGLEY